MRKESLEFLKELLTTPSPMGFESRGQKVWCDYAKNYADEVRTDAYGNAVAVLNSDGNPKILLDGHADEIGLMVKYIDDKGFIYFQRIGMVDPAEIRGKRVNIHSAKGSIRGVIGAAAIHLRERDAEPKVPKMHESFIDIGAKDRKAAEKKVSIGDPITFVDDFEIFSGTIAAGRGFDDRAGTWAVIEALRMLAAKRKHLKCAIYATSSIHEEGGTLAGATMQTYNIRPDAALVVDVGFATDMPDVKNARHGEVRMGNGPTVTIGRENHPVLVQRLRTVAKNKKIKLQTETFAGKTNSQAIFKEIGGVPSVIVGIPSRYVHTTVEMLDLKDLQHTVDLLMAFCLDIKKGERFKVKV
ncbi:MAG: M20/M25/M40 family metallo-hydrolase [Planctomycetota bacterium]|nr:M20/M25/M40 family metallo-hydrolase [Planctomycetota bacterium]